jgi:membrane protein YdbS with pleckstrin-like domain
MRIQPFTHTGFFQQEAPMPIFLIVMIALLVAQIALWTMLAPIIGAGAMMLLLILLLTVTIFTALLTIFRNFRKDYSEQHHQ